MAESCTRTGFWDRVIYCPGNNTTDSPNGLPAALAVASAALAAQVIAFMCIRARFTQIYSPKSHFVSERERVPAPPSGPFGWLLPIWTTKNRTLIEKCGLDSYFFLRFLRLQLKIFFPAALVLLTILLPLNSTGGGSETGLYRLSFSNVHPDHSNRLWVHLFCAIGFVTWVCYLVFHELTGYVRIRQTYMTSPQHRLRASATTVLVSGIPAKWQNVDALRGLFDDNKGGIRTIWINRDFQQLAKKIKYRTKIAESLENAETVLIKMCHKNEKKHASLEGREPDTQQLEAAGGISTGEHTETAHGMQDISKPRQTSPDAAIHGLDGAGDSEGSGRPSERRPKLHPMEIEEQTVDPFSLSNV